jgi:hypothetical protein
MWDVVRNSLGSVVALILLIVLTSISLGQPQTPYIYYYSDDASAFIIERADGSERTVLSSFYPCTDCQIVGPGWSPSGEWFAWTVDTIPETPRPPDEALVNLVNKSGTKLIVELNMDEVVRDLTWSPTTDNLLYSVYAESGSPIEYRVYDVDRQREVFKIKGPDQGHFEVEWTPFGSVLVYKTLSDMTQMHMYSADGTWLGTWEISPLADDRTLQCLPHWTLGGDVLYVDTSGTLLYGSMNQPTTTALVTDFGALLGVDWAPDRTQALLFSAENCDWRLLHAKGATLWLLSTENGSIEKIADSVVPFPDTDLTKANSFWSFEGSTFFYTKKDPRVLVRVDANTLDTTLVDLYFDERQLERRSRQGLWLDQDSLAVVGVPDPSDASMNIYRTDRGGRTEITTDNGVVNSLTLSPDATFMAYGAATCEGLCLVELATGKYTSIVTRFGPNGIPDLADEIVWAPESTWALASGRATRGSQSIVIFDAIAQEIRSLGGRYRISQPSSIGWMPSSK